MATIDRVLVTRDRFSESSPDPTGSRSLTSDDIGKYLKLTAVGNIILTVDSNTGWAISDEATFWYPATGTGTVTFSTGGGQSLLEAPGAITPGKKFVIKYDEVDTFVYVGPS